MIILFDVRTKSQRRELGYAPAMLVPDDQVSYFLGRPRHDIDIVSSLRVPLSTIPIGSHALVRDGRNEPEDDTGLGRAWRLFKVVGVTR